MMLIALRIALAISLLLSSALGFCAAPAGADASFIPEEAGGDFADIGSAATYPDTDFSQYSGEDPATLAAYDGNPVSIDLRGVDLKDALSALAIQMGVNIIIAGDENQQVTIQLKDVTPRQAMEIIINSKGMDYLEEGGIIVVGDIGSLQKNFFSQMIYTRYDTLYMPGGYSGKPL